MVSKASRRSRGLCTLSKGPRHAGTSGVLPTTPSSTSVPPFVIAAFIVTPVVIASFIIASFIVPTRPAILVAAASSATAISTLTVALVVPRVIRARVIRAFVCGNSTKQRLAQRKLGGRKVSTAYIVLEKWGQNGVGYVPRRYAGRGRTIRALRRTVVPSWRGGAGTATAGLFDGDDLANVLSRVEVLDGRFGVLRRLHRHKAKPA